MGFLTDPYRILYGYESFYLGGNFFGVGFYFGGSKKVEFYAVINKISSELMNQIFNQTSYSIFNIIDIMSSSSKKTIMSTFMS